MQYTFLCIDELDKIRFELSEMLKEYDINFSNARNTLEAAQLVNDNKDKINLIIWAINSPNLKKFVSMTQMKNEEAFASIPFIVVSSISDNKYVVKSIQAGALEYLVKPFEKEQVVKKIRQILGIKDDKKNRFRRTEDIITISFSEMLNKEIKTAGRAGHQLSLMIVWTNFDDKDAVDIKKSMNTVSSIIKTKLRETDTIFRYNENNLIVFLPLANNEGVKSVGSKIEELNKTNATINESGISLFTESITFPDEGKVPEILLQKLESKISKKINSRRNDA